MTLTRVPWYPSGTQPRHATLSSANGRLSTKPCHQGVDLGVHCHLLPSAGPWRSIGAAGCAKQIIHSTTTQICQDCTSSAVHSIQTSHTFIRGLYIQYLSSSRNSKQCRLMNPNSNSNPASVFPSAARTFPGCMCQLIWVFILCDCFVNSLSGYSC
jgi:hypothetical protein